MNSLKTQKLDSREAARKYDSDSVRELSNSDIRKIKDQVERKVNLITINDPHEVIFQD